MTELAQYLFDRIQGGELDPTLGQSYIAQVLPDDIAIVGMSCEYSGAPDLFGFEQLLRSGRNGFRDFPASRRKYFPKDHRFLVDAARYKDRDADELFTSLCDQLGSYLDDIDQFDAGFFGITDHEATYMDPTHRLVLKHLWWALEHAGITRSEIHGTRSAVYVGKDRSITGTYVTEVENDDPEINPGTWEGILASRLNYLWDLHGGSLVVDTACSSSLVGAHIASKMLRDREIDTALVGGIALGLAPRQGKVLGSAGGGVESVRDYMKVFDQESSGTIFGEGVGVVVLKRLSDALAHGDHVYSVLRGTGINSDGRSNGLTAPNPKAQTRLFSDVYGTAMITASTIDYIDAHGTGTKLGDPVEIRGLTDAFREDGATGYGTCALSSLKENVGHTVGAAGVGGLIKMSLALDSQLIFPSAAFEVPNTYIKFIDTPFYVPTALSAWPAADHPRRGAVSSFGFSGTNGHAVLEEFLEPVRTPHDGTPLPFVFSAPTHGQLVTLLDKFDAYDELITRHDLRDIAHTLRRRLREQVAVGFVAGDMADFRRRIGEARAVLAGTPVDGITLGEPGDHDCDAGDLALRLLRNGSALTLADRLALDVQGVEGFLDVEIADARQCALPGFAYATRPYWATVKTYNVYGGAAETGDSPVTAGVPVPGQLLTARVLTAPSTDVYRMDLEPSRWFLHDHRILGRPTLSGTGYTQLAAELATIYFQESSYRLGQLAFRKLIQVEHARSVMVEVAKAGSAELRVEVYADSDSGLESFGRFTMFRASDITDEGPGLPDTHLGLDGWIGAASLGAGSDDDTAAEDASGMSFRGRWNVADNKLAIKKLAVDEYLVRMTLPEAFSSDLTDFYLSPALVDLLAGVMSWERGQALGRSFLPLSYSGLQVTGRRFSTVSYSRTKLHYDAATDPSVVSADVWMYDAEGLLVAHIERYSMRALPVPTAPTTHSTIQWTPTEVPLETAPLTERRIAILDESSELSADGSDVAETLREHGAELVTVVHGVEELLTTGQTFDTLVLVQGGGAGLDATGAAKRLDAFFSLAQQVGTVLSGASRLVVVGRHLVPGAGSVDPLGYAVASAARVIGMETTRIQVTAVSDSELDVARALAVAATPALAGRRVLVTASGLSTEEVRIVDDLPVQEPELDGRAVLVTGGLGGIGLQYVRAVWEMFSCPVVVLGRRGLADLANSEDADDRARAAQAAALMADGLDLTVVYADLGDADSVRAALDTIGRERIGGVVHLAGVPEQGLLFRRTPQEFRQIVAPKVVGALTLAAELPDLELFVGASTMTTVLGSMSQFSYTVANAFLEGMSYAGTGVRVVRWPGWLQTGMAVRFGAADVDPDSFLLRPLTTGQGRDYVRESLRWNLPDVIAGTWSKRTAELVGDAIRLPASLAASVGVAAEDTAATAPQASTDGAPAAVKQFADLTVVGVDRELSDTEKFVTVLFASTLDLERIDVRSSFTDLGGDSLKAFSIYTPLVDQLHIDLEVADIFIHSSVLELSEHVEGLCHGK